MRLDENDEMLEVMLDVVCQIIHIQNDVDVIDENDEIDELYIYHTRIWLNDVLMLVDENDDVVHIVVSVEYIADEVELSEQIDVLSEKINMYFNL